MELSERVKKIEDYLKKNPPQSQVNKDELVQLSNELKIDGMRFFVAPGVDVSKESVIEDVAQMLKSVKRGLKKDTLILSSRNEI